MHLHVAGRLRNPRSQDDGVDKGYAAELDPFHEVGAKHDPASYIVSCNRGRFEPPRLDEFGKQAGLGSDGDVHPLPTLGLAKPEEVEHVYGEPVSEFRHDATPDVRSARGSMH